MALIQARKQDCRTQSEGRDLRAEGRWPCCLAGVLMGHSSSRQASGACGSGPGGPYLAQLCRFHTDDDI